MCPGPSEQHQRPRQGRAQFCTSLVHPAYWAGVVGRFGFCARMCLACAFDWMSPSVHSWHQQELIGVVFPKSMKNWSRLSGLVLGPNQRPSMPQTMTVE
jgi:hypothetical protein